VKCRKCGLELHLNWYPREGLKIDHVFPKTQFKSLDECAEWMNKYHGKLK